MMIDVVNTPSVNDTVGGRIATHFKHGMTAENSYQVLSR